MGIHQKSKQLVKGSQCQMLHSNIIFVAAFLTTARVWKQLKYPTVYKETIMDALSGMGFSLKEKEMERSAIRSDFLI